MRVQQDAIAVTVHHGALVVEEMIGIWVTIIVNVG